MTEAIKAVLRRLLADRRRARRYKAARKVRLAVGVTGGEGSPPVTLMGRTRDLSETGIALSLPVADQGGHSTLRAGMTLRLLLVLPIRTLDMRTEVVRAEPLRPEDEPSGQLVAVRITQMSRDDETYFAEYLSSLS